MTDKYIVERRCVFCRTVRPLKELIRTARIDGAAVLDIKGKAQGRGAYLCKAQKCIEGAKKHKALERSLKCRVDVRIYDEILKECADETR